MSKRALSTVATRHQVYLERLKTQFSADFTRVLPELEKAIRDVLFELQVDKLRDLSRRQLKTLLADLQKTQLLYITKAKQVMLTNLRGLAKYEHGFEARALSAAVQSAGKAWGVHELSAKETFKLVLEKPLSATGTLLEPFVDSWGLRHTAGVEAAVQRAWGEGRTIQQLVTEIRGTKKANFKDGLMAASRRNAEAIARTSTQHVAQASRTALWEANDDIVEGVIFVATLDSRTTEQCQALDGRVFPLDSGPRPPLHINCRSTTIPKLPKELDFLDKGATRSSANGYVDAKQTYYDWLGDQPAEFQNDALGADRAELFREGGLSAKEFADLSLDRNFRPMNLADMASREPSAFAEAGLDKYLPSE